MKEDWYKAFKMMNYRRDAYNTILKALNEMIEAMTEDNLSQEDIWTQIDAAVADALVDCGFGAYLTPTFDQDQEPDHPELMFNEDFDAQHGLIGWDDE